MSERTDCVFCVVGTEIANNILSISCCQRLNKRQSLWVGFIIIPPCIIHVSFHSKHFKDNMSFILIGFDFIKQVDCYVHPVKISVLWNVDNSINPKAISLSPADKVKYRVPRTFHRYFLQLYLLNDSRLWKKKRSYESKVKWFVRFPEVHYPILPSSGLLRGVK